MHHSNAFIPIILFLIMKEEEDRMVMAVIAGAAHGIRYKEKNPRASEEEVIQHITETAKDILANIDEEF